MVCTADYQRIVSADFVINKGKHIYIYSELVFVLLDINWVDQIGKIYQAVVLEYFVWVHYRDSHDGEHQFDDHKSREACIQNSVRRRYVYLLSFLSKNFRNSCQPRPSKGAYYIIFKVNCKTLASRRPDLSRINLALNSLIWSVKIQKESI